MKSIDELKKERTQIYIELGMYFDSLIRQGKIENKKAKELSAQLHKCERDMFLLDGIDRKEVITNCPSCSKELEEDAKFCASCGFNIEAYYQRPLLECRFCGNKQDIYTKFCSVCGIKL